MRERQERLAQPIAALERASRADLFGDVDAVVHGARDHTAVVAHGADRDLDPVVGDRRFAVLGPPQRSDHLAGQRAAEVVVELWRVDAVADRELDAVEAPRALGRDRVEGHDAAVAVEQRDGGAGELEHDVEAMACGALARRAGKRDPDQVRGQLQDLARGGAPRPFQAHGVEADEAGPAAAAPERHRQQRANAVRREEGRLGVLLGVERGDARQRDGLAALERLRPAAETGYRHRLEFVDLRLDPGGAPLVRVAQPAPVRRAQEGVGAVGVGGRPQLGQQVVDRPVELLGRALLEPHGELGDQLERVRVLRSEGRRHPWSVPEARRARRAPAMVQRRPSYESNSPANAAEKTTTAAAKGAASASIPSLVRENTRTASVV